MRPLPVHPASRRQRRRTPLGRQVRDALLHLYDLAYLQNHPLTTTGLIDGESTVGHAGQILQQRLIAMVEALRPPADVPDDALAHRGYRLLHLRYVVGLSVYQVCARLGISESGYHRVHGQCLDAIVSRLEEDRDRRGGQQHTRNRTTADGRGMWSVPLPTDRPPSDLPRPLTSLIGRRRELAQAMRLLAENQLLTMVGPPGVGKSRLALEVAARQRDRFADGVFFVPLAAVHDPTLVIPGIASVVGVREFGSKPLLEHLIHHLRERNTLLVLDNFEQVVDAASPIAALLGACSRLKLLATSRTPLKISGEQVLPIPPLEVRPTAPVRGESPEALLGALRKVDAVRLFVERTRAVQPDFTLTAENAPAVIEICRQLDGLPLAIELASARMRHLSPQAALARLRAGNGGGTLALLSEGPRDAPTRQRALREAIA